MGVEFNEYPKVLTHSGHKPAVIAHWDPKVKDQALQPQGQPEKFPNIMVNNKDQELQYASMGYRPAGVADEKAYMRAVLGADTPPSYTNIEYPKWLYKVDAADNLKSELVNDEAGEKKLGGGWHRTPDLARAAADKEPAEVGEAPAARERLERAAAPARPKKKKRAKRKDAGIPKVRRANPLTSDPAPANNLE